VIIVRAPYRVSLFGGGTDYPGHYESHGGQVLAATINKYCYITLRELPPFFPHRHRIVYSDIETVKNVGDIKHPAVRATLKRAGIPVGLEVHHDGDLPSRSGMGSSSTFVVALVHACAAFNDRFITKADLAKAAIKIERRDLGETVGDQDQYSAAYGGVNHMEFGLDRPCVPKPAMSHRIAKILNGHLNLFYTGIQRTASEIAATYVPTIARKRGVLIRTHELVDEALSIVQQPEFISLEPLGPLLDEAWGLKKSLSGAVSTTEIDTIYENAKEAGATGGKILGAGGGGFFLTFSPINRCSSVVARMRDMGITHVPFEFEYEGSTVLHAHRDK
jgi:D-glycero-alpha-D-manno-heptose-7-phosphate kinase